MLTTLSSIWSVYNQFLFGMMPIIFYLSPFFLVPTLWNSWIYYIRYKNLKSLEWILLEIKMPQEIAKSPAGMEVIFSALHQTGDGNIVDRYLKGKVRPHFSLEICSFGGEVKFFMRVEKKFKNLVEATVYGQYPEVEIHEVEDYVHNVPFGLPNSGWDMWAVKFGLEKPDPYPIKTYIDYALDKKEKDALVNIDPLTPIIELFGSIKPNEQMCMHIMIMAARNLQRKPGGSRKDKIGWKEEGEAIVNEMMRRDPVTKSSRGVSAAGFPIMPTMTDGEKEVIAALGRSTAKLGFEAGIKTYYFAQGEIELHNKVGIFGSMKQFNSSNLNGFKPVQNTHYELPWQDFKGIRLALIKSKYFKTFRLRSYFFPPYVSQSFILNTEELATIFHFPGGTSKTPTFDRIMSKRAEPPSNLPI